MESHFWIVKEFLPAMIKKNQGMIVSIASMAGTAGQPLMTDYCASKFGAIGMMDALRLELKRENKNVKCLTVCPFYINTGMFDGVDTGAFFGFLD
jgi:all-trans-retinol dehydrogenase (NAD+)